jgi:hypothetical protein
MEVRMTDLTVRNEGTIVQIIPNTLLARNWISENVQSEGWQWLGMTLCVDHRMAGPLLEGAILDGLTVN